MDEIRTDSAENLINDFMDCKQKYKNPFFVCDNTTLLKIVRIHDDAIQYFFDIKEHTFLGRLCVSDNKVRGLYVRESFK